MSKMAPAASKFDHEDRLDLKKLLEKPRVVKPLADVRMKVTLGPGQVKKISMKEMHEEYKTFDEGGQLLLNDGTLMIPVVDYLKANLKIKSVETVERMERELNLMHQDLISKGSTEEEVKNVIKTSDKYAKYQKLMSETAEVIVKETLEGLAIPGLIIRSVVKLDVWRRCSQLYLRAGLSLSGVDRKEKDFKNDEYDLQMVFADGDNLNWILVEVKNSNSYPWEATVSPPNPSLFEGNLKEVKRNPKKAKENGLLGSAGQKLHLHQRAVCRHPLWQGVCLHRHAQHAQACPGKGA